MTFVQFLVILRPPSVDEVTMIRIFVLDHFAHRIPNGADTSLIQEIPHIDTATVDKFTIKIFIFHQSVEEACVFLFICPGSVTVIVRRINPFYGVVIRRIIVESNTKVGILCYPTPSATLCPRSPHNIVVAREVLIVEVEVHDHEVDILLPVHALCIFRQSVTMFFIEGLELYVFVLCSLFQVIIFQ